MLKKLIVIMIAALFGCVSDAPGLEKRKIAEKFFSQYISIPERLTEFGKFSLQDKYELFKFGNRIVHPPAIYLAKPFAEEGRAIIPFLSQKLVESDDEAEIRDIALLLLELSRLKPDSLHGEHEVLRIMDDKTKRMRGIWKDVARGFFLEMQGIVVNESKQVAR